MSQDLAEPTQQRAGDIASASAADAGAPELWREEDITQTPVTFAARDEYALSGLWVRPPAPQAWVLLSSGTGFPKEYYRRFARWGAQRGAAVLLYDYRGIGGSAPADLATMEMDYPDWGRLDMAAAIDVLAAEAGDAPKAHIGHSVGGHFIGFADTHAKIDRHAFLCVGTGYWAKHFWTNRPMELTFWWLYGPACLAMKGYIPAGGLWGGTALPRGVYTTWRRWCAKPRYFLDELESVLAPNSFADVRAPIRSWIYTDDPIATPETGRDLLHAYPNAEATVTVRRPRDYGLRSIGHAGVFREKNRAAWGEVWDWTLEPSSAGAPLAPV